MADMHEANREEGELSEEGELPDEEAEEGEQAQEDDSQKAEDDSAKPKDGTQQMPAAASTQSPAVEEQQQQPAEKPSRARQELQRGREGSSHDRDRRDSQHHVGSKGGDGHDRHREREQDRHRLEREKLELMHELDRLTYDLSFQDIRSNWVVACQDLKTAIKKLDKLLRRVKKKREDDVDLYPAAYNYSTRIYNALKHVIVICSTGLGKLADMELANALMRAAVNYRHDVFSLSQKRELEQQLRDSKEFRHLFTDRDRGRSSSKANGAAGASAAAATATAGAGGSSRGDGEQREQRPRLQRGQPQQAPLSARSDGMQTSASKDDAVSEASHAAAGATSSRGPLGTTAAAAAAGDQAPPSPPGTASAARSAGGPTSVAGPSPADAPSSSAAAASAPEPAAQASGYGGSSGWGAGSGGGACGGGLSSNKAAASASKGPQIRIVINSTLVAQGAAADAVAGATGSAGAAGGSTSSGAAAAGSGGGLKRPMPQIQDLDAEEEEEQQQLAKRVRQQEPGPGPSAMNGVALSELPEVKAAMNNPGQLQMVLQNLLSSHRLCLVLDLDHTLVNSAKFAEVDADWEYKLEQLAAEQLSRPKESRDLHRLARVSMWTKLRPGVREFLRRAAERFELWIYTAGSKVYADAMVELLDPSGQYFGGRVIAQGVPTAPDETPADAVVFKRLMQGLEGREPVVVIVDDSSAVWPHDRQNLFVVERYIYFPSSRKRFGMQGKSLLEIDRDECPSRGMLMTALRIFEHLHDVVFARMRSAPLAATAQAAAVWDVRSVMAAEKKQVLAGVNLVFSRVIPLESNPRQHPLWQLAEQFGATCGEQCTDATTHVVATHGGTEKVMWAKQNNVHVVSPAWLECSCILWQRANEEKFPTPL